MNGVKRANDGAVNGTSLMGYLDISYGELVSVLGPPHCDGDGYKVDAEWILEFEDGAVATIYNYKTGINYNGARGTKIEDERDWHVGGKHVSVVDRVRALFS